MTTFTYKDLIDIMFEHAEEVMRQLCEENQRQQHGYTFTSQQFVKRIAQQNQDVYVQLLERCRVHFPDYIFNKAHECIGLALSRRAEQAGFEKTSEGRTETDIFDNPANRITYRPQ